MLETLSFEIPTLTLPTVEVNDYLSSTCNLTLLILCRFQVPNRPTRINANDRITNVRNTVKADQPAPTNNANTNINLGSLPAAT